MLKPSSAALGKHFHLREGIYVAYRGPSAATQRLFLHAGCHGQEIASPIALAQLLSEDWAWPKVAMAAVFADPVGYDHEGYGFVSVDGHESSWPPLWGYRMDGKGYWANYDRNSLWGNTDVAHLPPSHLEERHVLRMAEPTFTLALHETVRSEVERDAFWVGAAPLLIETWPISAAESRALSGGHQGNTPASAISTLLSSWLRSFLGLPKWHRTVRAVEDNPYYKLISRIVSEYELAGGAVVGRKWTRYLVGQLVIGPGRILHDPMITVAEWKTVTDYALSEFGCPGITVETFQAGEVGLRGIEQRVSFQLGFIRAVLNVLEAIA